MTDIATCASCGTIQELCNSLRINGIQQPRLCKDCITVELWGTETKIVSEYWLQQVEQLGDKKTLDAWKEEE